MNTGCIIGISAAIYVLITYFLLLSAITRNWEDTTKNLLMVIFWPFCLIASPFIGLSWLRKNRKDIIKIIIRKFYT